MQSESCVQGRPVVPSGTSDVVEDSVAASSKRMKIGVPVLALVPLEAPLVEEVHVSPFGQVVALEQPDTKAMESPTAVTRPKNIERISFLLDPPTSRAYFIVGPRDATPLPLP